MGGIALMGFGVGPEPAVAMGPPQPHLQGQLASTCTSLPPCLMREILGGKSTHPPQSMEASFPGWRLTLAKGTVEISASSG